MKFYLIVAKGKKHGMPIEIKADLFLIGSDPICQLRKKRLANKHCAIVSRDKKFYILDMTNIEANNLDSESGQVTLVNNSLLPAGEEWPLHNGDRITIGSLEFLIQFRETALSPDDAEEWANKCLDKSEEEAPKVEDDAFSGQLTTAVDAAASILNSLNALKGEVKGRLRVAVERQGIILLRLNDARLVEESEISLVKKELCENADKRNVRLLLDMKNVRRMSTGAVVMLTEVNRWIRARGGSMAICRIRPELASALSLLSVENVRTYSDKKQALAANW